MALSAHVDACPRCRTELRLLQIFQSGQIRPDEEEAVRRISSQLRAREAAVFGKPRARRIPSLSGWQRSPAARWVRPAGLAFAGLLAAAGITLQMHHGTAPPLHPPAAGEPLVFRAGSVEILAPAGDVSQRPGEIRWRPVTGAVRYDVQLLEVDGTEFWRAETAATNIAIPPEIRVRIAPAKTVTCRVTAWSSVGRKMADSVPIRFRFRPNLH